jgi:hypothetical protein
VALLVLLDPTPALAAPDPLGAWAELIGTPLRVTGDLLGATGLFAAAAVALGGDVFAVLDARRGPPGPVSGPIHRIAMAVSHGGTGMMEGLRDEDIERFPEARTTYVTARPGRGRIDTLLSGGGAVRLAVRDVWSGPALTVLRLVGASGWAGRVSKGRDELRIRLLGPLPAPTPEGNGPEGDEAGN